MASLKTIRREFMAELATRLKTIGFQKSGQVFHRPVAHGMDIIEVTFVSHSGINFEAELAIGVSHTEVERLFHELTPDYPEAYARWTWTIGNRLDNMFRDFVDWKWPVSNEQDVEHAISCIMSAVETVALPYFERFSSLEEVLRVVAKRDAESRRLDLEAVVPSHAIITAFVLGRRDVFEQIIVSWTPRLIKLAHHRNPRWVELAHQFWRDVDELRRRWDERAN